MSLLTVQQINIFNFDFNILSFLSKKDCHEQEKACQIIDKINYKKNYTHIKLDYLTFILDYSSFENSDIEYNSNKTKSITVTPSRIIYNIPTPNLNNHFQRKLIDYNDNIIKISVVDEDKSNFNSADINQSIILVKFVENLFKNGINLGFLKYNYIGSSNSKLKKLSGWMVNLEGIRTNNIVKKDIIKSNNFINEETIVKSNNSFQLYNNCEEIINKFGDFSQEKNIFKNTSRKGMIFSDTKYIVDVDINNVKQIKDEMIGKYVITDGIGKISSDLLELSAKKWGIKDLELSLISSIQFRFMGCKGVFAVDPNLPKNTIHYRESQKKYTTE
jgi:RNA-dependent RNA polymerase